MEEDHNTAWEPIGAHLFSEPTLSAGGRPRFIKRKHYVGNERLAGDYRLGQRRKLTFTPPKAHK
jgi:hypothetical protein